MSGRASALALAVLAALGGCSAETGFQQPTPRLQLDLVAVPTTGSREQPVSVIGQVANAGPVAVTHANPCATEGFEWSATFGDSAQVFLDPPGTLAGCPPQSAELGAGGIAEGGVLFDGTLYTPQGDPYDAPAGAYTVRAAWKFWTQSSGADSSRLRGSVVIRWESVLARETP